MHFNDQRASLFMNYQCKKFYFPFREIVPVEIENGLNIKKWRKMKIFKSKFLLKPLGMCESSNEHWFH